LGVVERIGLDEEEFDNDDDNDDDDDDDIGTMRVLTNAVG